MCSSLFARLNRWKQNPCFFEEMLVKFRKYISCVILHKKNFICFEIKPYVSAEKTKRKKNTKNLVVYYGVFIDVLARI